MAAVNALQTSEAQGNEVDATTTSVDSRSCDYVTARCDVSQAVDAQQPQQVQQHGDVADDDDTLHDVDALSDDCDDVGNSLAVRDMTSPPSPRRVCQLRMGGRSTSFDSDTSSVAIDDGLSLSDSCCGSSEHLHVADECDT